MTEIIDYYIKEINKPLETPLKTFKGGSDEINNLYFVLETDEELFGVGEASPSLFTGETTGTVKAALEGIGEKLIQENPLKYKEIIEELRNKFFSQYSAVTAAEIALFDYLSKKWSISLSNLFGGGNEEIRTDITIPIASVEKNKELIQHYLNQGYCSFKIKAGKEPKKDLDRIKSIQEIIKKENKDFSIKIDFNQALNPKQANRFLSDLENQGIFPDLIEQPVPKNHLDALKEVKKNSFFPVAADESLFTPMDALRLIKKEAVDVFNIKLMESGILGALDIISLAKNTSIELMIGCMTETQVSIKTAASIAQGTNEFKYIDLDSHKFLGENIKEVEPGPRIDLSNELGHGVGINDL